MNIIYKEAGPEDLALLTDTRIRVLRAANKLDDDTDMSKVKKETESYYKKALADGSHLAILIFDGDEREETDGLKGCHEGRFVGAGGVSFYKVMPTYDNPAGTKAYIMNMYTAPEYRRQGIAMKTLDTLVKRSRQLGIDHIILEATDMGRPLYEKYGFVSMKNEMILKEK